MAEGTAQGLDHQGRIHVRIQLPADDAMTEQIYPESEILLAGARADAGDLAGPATFGRLGFEPLPQQVLHHPNGASSPHGAGPERLRVLAMSPSRRISRATDGGY